MATDEKNIKPTIPEWIKSEAFENLLKEIEPGYRSTKNFTVQNALAPGENYATIMLRLEFEIELEDGSTSLTSLMVKVPHTMEKYDEWISKHNFFTIEVDMYYTIIPELESMYKDIGVDIKFATNCFKLPVEGNYVLLRDLRPLGFKNANRLEGLDMEHMKNVLKKLAMLHAASAVRAQTRGPYSKGYLTSVYDTNITEFIDPMIESYRISLLDRAKKIKDSSEWYNAYESFYSKYMIAVLKAVNIDENEFNVLNHGDCWTNNIMFKYSDDGKIDETYFVDLQMPKYGSPAQDLLYFILSSANFDLKLNKFDYFIKYYHDILVENLRLLSYPKEIPTLKDIHQLLFKYIIWGYQTLIMALPPILLDRGTDASMDGFISDTEAGNNFRTKIVSGARYVKHFEAILPWLINRGVLDL